MRWRSRRRRPRGWGEEGTGRRRTSVRRSAGPGSWRGRWAGCPGAPSAPPRLLGLCRWTWRVGLGGVGKGAHADGLGETAKNPYENCLCSRRPSRFEAFHVATPNVPLPSAWSAFLFLSSPGPVASTRWGHSWYDAVRAGGGREGRDKGRAQEGPHPQSASSSFSTTAHATIRVRLLQGS